MSSVASFAERSVLPQLYFGCESKDHKSFTSGPSLEIFGKIDDGNYHWWLPLRAVEI
jgi:hypothetical protein